MFRLLLVIFLSWFCLETMAQGVEIPKSTDIIVIRGKSYYLHTVGPGQTLYSICKAYGVDVEEVKALNDKKDNNLSLYEVLKVPYIEPFVQQDSRYFYHKVAKGETLYSLSRRYGIKPKRLLKANPEYSHNEPLAVGAVVKLPLDEIDKTALNPGGQTATTVVEVVADRKGKVEKTEEPFSETSISIEPETENKTLVTDTLPVAGVWQDEEEKEMPEYISEVVMPEDPFVKVALLLPFSAKDYPFYIDSMAMFQSVNISSRSEQFVQFYEGILLAVDSLKKRGYRIDLHVYDTERSAEKIYEITEEVNRLNPDMIIGPVYGSEYKVMVENLTNKQIPVVYPLSSRSENFGEYPDFIQVNASLGGVFAKMASWLKTQQMSANIIYLGLGDTDDYAMQAEKNLFKEQLKESGGIKFFRWDMEAVPLDSLRTLLLPDRENVLVVPTSMEAEVSKVLPILSSLTDGYQITVLGLPEWQTFTSVDHETYYKLNTKIFTYSYVDHTSESARQLAEKYRRYFYSEPHSLVYKAFDMGMYFIELAVKYRDRSLEALEYYPRDGSFSRFRFRKMLNGAGKENQGFFIVNFGSDYHLKIESL